MKRRRSHEFGLIDEITQNISVHPSGLYYLITILRVIPHYMNLLKIWLSKFIIRTFFWLGYKHSMGIN